MKLLKLWIENFRGVSDGKYSFTHPTTDLRHDLVLITGDAGAGKTSLLGAIAALKELVGGYGPPPDVARLRRSGTTTGKISATWQLSDEEAARSQIRGNSLVTEVTLADGPVPLLDAPVRALFAEFSVDPSRGKFESFPASRRLSLAPALPGRPTTFAAARHRLSSDPGKYHGLRAVLVEMAVSAAMKAADRLDARGVLTKWEQPDSFAAIKRSVSTLAPWLCMLGVQQEEGGASIRFERDNGARIELADLSESEQQALLFAVVFDRLGLNRSIVLIDTPELFLPPDAHVSFLRALLGLGADNQIFAATTSPSLLEMVSPSQVVRLDTRGK
jgi:predicted ATPase